MGRYTSFNMLHIIHYVSSSQWYTSCICYTSQVHYPPPVIQHPHSSTITCLNHHTSHIIYPLIHHTWIDTWRWVHSDEFIHMGSLRCVHIDGFIHNSSFTWAHSDGMVHIIEHTAHHPSLTIITMVHIMHMLLITRILVHHPPPVICHPHSSTITYLSHHSSHIIYPLIHHTWLDT